MKNTKELDNLIESIQKWEEKHKGNVQFVGSFLAFKGKNFDITDDVVFAYGMKSTIRDVLKDIDEMVEKEQGEFINW